MVTVIVVAVCSVSSFVAGVLVGRRNKQTVEKAVSTVNAEIKKL